MEKSHVLRTSCDACKRSKLKCRRDEDCNRCARCEARDTECIVTGVVRKKRAKKDAKMSAMTERIQRMEAIISASGIEMKDGEKDIDPNVDLQTDLSDKFSMLIGKGGETSAFLGSASGISIFSPQGIRWITEKTGSDDLARVVHFTGEAIHKSMGSDRNTTMWRPLQEQDRMPLPEVETGKIYIKLYFENFNNFLPLYDQRIVEARYVQSVTHRPEDDPPWYATLNVMFAIGRAISRGENGPDEISERYLRNASSMFIDLTFRPAGLMTVQVLIALAWVVQTIEDSLPCYMLATAAVRIAQSIGLHRRLDENDIPHVELEQRRNLFWMAYILEKAICLRAGRPGVIHDEDIGVALPQQAVLSAGSNSSSSGLRNMARLAILEGRVYSKLYSARCQSMPEADRLIWVGRLDAELQQWRNSIAVGIRPEEARIICPKMALIDVMVMHLEYFNCLIAVHRRSIYHGSWTANAQNDIKPTVPDKSLNPRVYESAEICVRAARSVVNLLHHYETVDGLPDLSLITICDYYPLTACLTIFAYILQNPNALMVHSDLELLKNVESLFHSSFSHESSEKSIMTFVLFKHIVSAAESVVAKAGSPREDVLAGSSRNSQHRAKSDDEASCISYGSGIQFTESYDLIPAHPANPLPFHLSGPGDMDYTTAFDFQTQPDLWDYTDENQPASGIGFPDMFQNTPYAIDPHISLYVGDGSSAAPFAAAPLQMELPQLVPPPGAQWNVAGEWVEEDTSQNVNLHRQ